MKIIQIPVLEDNYTYLIVGEDRLTALVDAPVFEPVADALDREGLGLDFIWNTHHHSDHVGSNLRLKNRFGCKILGSAEDSDRIPGIDRKLLAGELFAFDGQTVEVIPANGHTLGHIAFWIPSQRALFSGDTIFSLGCGKLFEGTAAQMWETLDRLRKLPDDTRIYGAHEYTLDNALFALKAEPNNKNLQDMVQAAREKRRWGKPTVPTFMGQEKAANPFLRPESKELQEYVKKFGKENWEIFAALREAKDRFDQNFD